MQVIITSPSLNTTDNVSGISAVTRFITSQNTCCEYTHFLLGKKDAQTRDLLWLLRTLKVYAKWAQVLLMEPLAIIHFNIAFDLRSLIRDLPLIMIARLLRRRVIIHIHGGKFLAGEGMPSGLKMIVRLTLSRGPIIVLSHLERAMIERMTRNAKILVLANCIEVEEAEAFERGYPSEEPLIILFLGRITARKGIEVLYQGLAASREGGTRFRFVMAGAGPAEKLYVCKFRELLGEDFEFRGVISGAEKTDVLKKCNVFVLPSLYGEGMPMALLESMAFGLVPITTDIASISTIVTNGINGIIVNRGAPGEIRDAIDKLATEKQCMRALSMRGRQHILDICRPDAYVEQLNAIYEH